METINGIKKVKIGIDPHALVRPIGAIDNIFDNFGTGSLTNRGNCTIIGKNADLTKYNFLSDNLYYICYPFNLKDESITIPKNCTLEFHGGYIKNGTLVGEGANIIADYKIFYNVKVEGEWKCVGNALWWCEGSKITHGTYTDDYGEHSYENYSNKDDGDGIQAALDSSFSEIIFPPMLYYTSKTLVLSKGKKLTLQGAPMRNSLYLKRPERINTAVIYTDVDLDLLVLKVTENGNEFSSSVVIEGGNFDVSYTRNEDKNAFIDYTHSVIKVCTDDYNARIWGLTINTAIFGRDSKHGIGINLGPDKAEIKESEYDINDYGYATQIKLGGVINNLGTGIRAESYWVKKENKSVCYNWVTGLIIDTSILDCEQAIYIKNADADIRGLIQAPSIESAQNETALIHIDSTFPVGIGASIFDVGLPGKARYAVSIDNENNCPVQAYGLFASQCRGVAPKNLCTGFTNRFYYA